MMNDELYDLTTTLNVLELEFKDENGETEETEILTGTSYMDIYKELENRSIVTEYKEASITKTPDVGYYEHIQETIDVDVYGLTWKQVSAKY